MGVCMGKDSSAITSDLLDPDGRFIQSSKTMLANPIYPHGLDGEGPSSGSHRHSQNDKLSPPRSPVIFVLGGPGSGKITHCDRAVQERQGLAHINMTDLIQQHIVGNNLSDFALIPPSNLIEVLQMEIKMAVNARGYLISGYPRSMRDVVEYQSKLHRVDQVILLNWHIRILEKQIEYGSQLGATVLQLARMELKNYSKNVLAVAEYFDQMNKLTVVDGERQPTDVYEDFLASIDSVLSRAALVSGGTTSALGGGGIGRSKRQANGVIPSMTALSINSNNNRTPMAVIKQGHKVIWIIGGPGSNKSLLSSTSVRLHHSGKWEWLSIGEELRRVIANRRAVPGISGDQIVKIKNTMNKGDLVNDEAVMALIADSFNRSRKKYFVIDGFPRNLQQVELFRDYFPLLSPPPPCILVDCSEVELGRSLGQRANNRLSQQREDDQNSGAVKRRLDTYRTVTLPTLKLLDDQHRLHIIDGDLEDKARVVEEFNEVLGQLIDSFENPGDPKHKLGIIRDSKRKSSIDMINGMYDEVTQQQ